MVYFQTKNPDLGTFFECLGRENVCLLCVNLEYFTAILCTYIMAIGYILWLFIKKI
jgi:hypothetical protein